MAQVAKIDVDLTSLISAQKQAEQQVSNMRSAAQKTGGAFAALEKTGKSAFDVVAAGAKIAVKACSPFIAALDKIFKKLRLAAMLSPFKALLGGLKKATVALGAALATLAGLLAGAGKLTQGATRLRMEARGSNMSVRNYDALRKAGETTFGGKGGGELALGMAKSVQNQLYDPEANADFVKATGYTQDAFHGLSGEQALFKVLQGAQQQVRAMGGFDSYAGNEVAVKSLESITGLGRAELKGMFETGKVDELIKTYGEKREGNKNREVANKEEEKAEKALTNLSHEFENLWDVLKKTFLPVLPPLIEKLTEFVRWAAAILDKNLPAWAQVFFAGLEKATDAIESFIGGIVSAATWLGDLISPFLPELLESWRDALSAACDVLRAGCKLMKPVWEWLGAGIKKVLARGLTLLVNGLKSGAKFLKSFAAKLKTAAGMWDAIKKAASGIWEAVKRAASSIWEAVKNVASGIWEAVKRAASSIWEPVKRVASGIWEAVKNVASGIWEAVKRAASGIWEAVKNVASGIWEPVKQAASSIWEPVKQAASSIWEGVGSVISSIIGVFESLGFALKRFINSLPLIGGVNLKKDNEAFDLSNRVSRESGRSLTLARAEKGGRSRSDIAEIARAIDRFGKAVDAKQIKGFVYYEAKNQFKLTHNDGRVEWVSVHSSPRG